MSLKVENDRWMLRVRFVIAVSSLSSGSRILWHTAWASCVFWLFEKPAQDCCKSTTYQTTLYWLPWLWKNKVSQHLIAWLLRADGHCCCGCCCRWGRYCCCWQTGHAPPSSPFTFLNCFQDQEMVSWCSLPLHCCWGCILWQNEGFAVANGRVVPSYSLCIFRHCSWDKKKNKEEV